RRGIRSPLGRCGDAGDRRDRAGPADGGAPARNPRHVHPRICRGRDAGRRRRAVPAADPRQAVSSAPSDRRNRRVPVAISRTSAMSKNLVVFAVYMLIAGAATAQQGTVEVTDAWARATPGKAENGAAYLTIASPTADRLTGRATPVATKAELHMMTMEVGIMRMRPLAGIDLPPGQKVTLRPGGV